MKFMSVFFVKYPVGHRMEGRERTGESERWEKATPVRHLLSFRSRFFSHSILLFCPWPYTLLCHLISSPSVSRSHLSSDKRYDVDMNS